MGISLSPECLSQNEKVFQEVGGKHTEIFIYVYQNKHMSTWPHAFPEEIPKEIT